MLWLTLIVALLVSAAVVLYVIRPLIDQRPAPIFIDDDRLTDLMTRKDVTLRAIKDLEFDYHVGKVSEEDFERFKQTLSQQAIGLIQQIEKIAPESSRLDDAFEAEIARLRKTLTMPQPLAVRPQISAPVSSEATTNGAPKSRLCTECGHPLGATHKFCAHCGAPVTTTQPQP